MSEISMVASRLDTVALHTPSTVSQDAVADSTRRASEQATQPRVEAKQPVQAQDIHAQKTADQSQIEQRLKAPEEEAKAIKDAAKTVENFMSSRNHNVSFSLDEESGHTIIKVMDKTSKEVIRQIPSEEILAIAEKVKELENAVGSATGLFFAKTV